MPVPASWKKGNKYGKSLGHLINMGYSPEAAKSKIESAIKERKKK